MVVIEIAHTCAFMYIDQQQHLVRAKTFIANQFPLSIMNCSTYKHEKMNCQGKRKFRKPWALKPIFHLANLFARTDKKEGTVPTRSRRIFSPVNFNQSRCQILVFASRRANKVAKWKIRLSRRLVACYIAYSIRQDVL